MVASIGGVEAMKSEVRDRQKLREIRMIMQARAERGEVQLGRIDSQVLARRVVPRLKKGHENEMIAAGAAADGRQRWAVDRVLGWRGRGASREAKVKWLGFDRMTGVSLGEEWISRKRLTADLRVDGAIKKGRKSRTQLVIACRQEPAGWRSSPRVAGRAPGEGLS